MNPGAESEPMNERDSARLVEAMEKEGYLPTAKANLELTESLEKIKVSCAAVNSASAVGACSLCTYPCSVHLCRF